MTARAADGSWIGPGAPTSWDWSGWAEQIGEVMLSVHGDLDLEWEGAALRAAALRGSPLLSVRVAATEVLIGPLWMPDNPASCR